MATSTADAEEASPSSSAQSSQAANWHWRWVLGKCRGRKPAILRPARHQWWFCNPNYDPMQPLPRKMLPPHAPPTADDVDEWKAYYEHLPSDPAQVPKYRRQFMQYLRLRELDWRNAFHQGLAADVRRIKREERAAMEAQRQRSWAKYRNSLFKKAAAQLPASTSAEPAGPKQ